MKGSESMREYPRLRVSQKAERSLRGGHPWVYDQEITSMQQQPADGGIVDVYSEKDRWLGAGYYNSHSRIRVRIISRNPNDRFDEAFYARRVRYALDYRKAVMGPEDYRCCRLIFGEADQFPGLTADRYEDILVTQVLSLGTELVKPWIYQALVDCLRQDGVCVRAIYERNDMLLRQKEGMDQQAGFYILPGLTADTNGHVIIRENGITYDVDYIQGQKTGFFLDQKYNRAAAARLAAGRRVLDCFTHTGAFGLNAALGGAEHVTAIDVSAAALESAKTNARLSGLADRIDFVQADVFAYLTELGRGPRGQFDYIILDPPAFTKSSATVRAAYSGYKQINLRAMKLLPRGGYLATCSCSRFMTDTLFEKMLAEAASDADVRLRQIENRRQAPDHPILWGVPETEYLKFYLFQVV